MARIHVGDRRAHANVCGHERGNENVRGHECDCARDRPQHVCARLRRRRVDVEYRAPQAGYRHRLRLTVQNK